MLDYIYFDVKLSNKFKNYLIKMGIKFKYEQDSTFSSVQDEIVSIADETSESLYNCKKRERANGHFCHNK